MSLLPPDRKDIATEQRNPRSRDLHRKTVAELVTLVQAEDATLPQAMAGARAALVDFLQAAAPRFAAGGRLIYLGAGTSGRLGVLDASEAPPTFCVPPGRVVGIIAGGDSSLRLPSEGAEDNPDGALEALRALQVTAQDTVVGIAAGGTTPYVQGGLRHAKAFNPGVLTALLSCAAIERPAGADHLIVLATGPELLTGSTRMKAGTATKLALNTISTVLMIRSGLVYDNLMVNVKASNAKLRDRAARIISQLCNLDRPAAFAALAAAGDAVSCAVVMQRCGLSRAAAQARLDAAAGRLDLALESTP